MSLRIFIGYDPVETIAYHVLAHSIIKRASEPVSIAPVGNTVLPKDLWWRKRGPYDSTEFSNARFLVPYLAGFQGWAVFMDCDMLCLADIYELAELADANPDKAVLVRQHKHQPDYSEKFLGAVQTQYDRKNWSSMMLLNCGHPVMENLEPAAANDTPGLKLHDFSWCPDDCIGALPEGWNLLVEHRKPVTPGPHKLVHFTQGGPWHGYLAQPYAEEWQEELEDLLIGTNPRAAIQTEMSVSKGRLRTDLEYAVDTGRPGDRIRSVSNFK